MGTKSLEMPLLSWRENTMPFTLHVSECNLSHHFYFFLSFLDIDHVLTGYN